MSKNDYNYEELIREYGEEYLQESDYYDRCPIPMDEFEQFTNYTPLEAITRAFYGYRWLRFERDEYEAFNPNDEYFTFNGYGNLVSISEYDYEVYMKSEIDETDFIEWCVEQGYLDEE